jgi:probable HAF family extracellular repeat protein
MAINASGQVVGWAQTASGETHAFLYDGAALRDLGTLGGGWAIAAAINASGQVAGYGFPPSGGYHAFLYDGAALRDLGTLGGSTSFATAINAGGQVVGGADTPSGGYHAFLYDGAALRDLGTLGGNGSVAYAINASGQVAGYGFPPSGGPHAFLYDGAALRDLGTLGGGSSIAVAINASGQAVGHAVPPSGGLHAFLYDGAALRDLGTLGGDHSDAMAINASGQVVGRAETASGETHAFLYDGAALRDLNALLDVSGDGWTVLEARAINDAGQIAAIASDRDAVYRAVLLTPRITVPIEIRPGSSSGPFNPKAQGRIPVAILSAPAFDAPAQIDQDSLTFGRTGDEPSLAFCNPIPRDVNGDGLPDLVCHFHTHAAGLQARDTQGVLKGRTESGISLVGSDSVHLAPARGWLRSPAGHQRSHKGEPRAFRPLEMSAARPRVAW